MYSTTVIGTITNNNMGYIIVIFSLFSVIFLHELGHLIAGLLTNTAIKSFNVGFGRRILRTKVFGIEVNFRIFLIMGGYVSFKTTKECKDYETSIEDIKYWKKIIVNLGGVIANFLIAYLTLLIVSLAVGLDIVTSIKTSASLFFNVLSLSFFGMNKINEFSSPIGLVAQGGSMIQSLPDKGYVGIVVSYFLVSAMLHVGVGFSNLLPLSILDGGQCIVDTIKALSSKQSIARKFLVGFETISFLLLGFMFVYLVSKDTISVFKTVLKSL